ncbi:MAG: TatD family hydrolase, partial [Pontibacterium sp.]
MFIDSHCHLDRVELEPYHGQFDAMLKAAQDREITKMLCVSIELEQFEGMYARIENYPFIDASVGVHPLNTNGAVTPVERLIELANKPRIVAIGETGLDYYYSQDGYDVQQQSFINHLKASAITRLPTIIHTRDAREDTL